MEPLRDWTIGDDILEAAHHQQVVEAVRGLYPLTTGPGMMLSQGRFGGVLNMAGLVNRWRWFVGRIMSEGPTIGTNPTISDFGDCRYWVRIQYLTGASPYDEAAIPLMTNDNQVDGRLYSDGTPCHTVPVFNLAELDTDKTPIYPHGRQHRLKPGMFVQVFEIWTADSAGAYNTVRWYIDRDPEVDSVPVPVTIIADDNTSGTGSYLGTVARAVYTHRGNTIFADLDDIGGDITHDPRGVLQEINNRTDVPVDGSVTVLAWRFPYGEDVIWFFQYGGGGLVDYTNEDVSVGQSMALDIPSANGSSSVLQFVAGDPVKLELVAGGEENQTLRWTGSQWIIDFPKLHA